MPIQKLLETPFAKLILSNKQDKANPYNKVVIAPIMLKNKQIWQATRYTDKQAFQENIVDKNKLLKYVAALFENSYKQLNFFGETENVELKQSKKGKILKSVQKHESAPVQAQEHNRKKRYLLTEGRPLPALVDMGVMTKDGKIIHAQMDKFRQINSFLQIIDDTLKTWPQQQITVMDFGCGKSYLTFVLYHYLTEIKGLNAHIIGLDLKEEVIEKCNIVAQKYGYKNLHFEISNIKGYRPSKPVDMIISLHACDTATDFALANAIGWNVPMILSVPCCQHEVNTQMKNPWPLITKYGLLKERFSALLTDAIRANLLESAGYQVQLLEFTDITHTPKNLLIRAIKTGKKAPAKATEEACTQFGIQPTLYRLLNATE